jgi:hypothetical protein
VYSGFADRAFDAPSVLTIPKTTAAPATIDTKDFRTLRIETSKRTGYSANLPSVHHRTVGRETFLPAARLRLFVEGASRKPLSNGGFCSAVNGRVAGRQDERSE